jgi:hypothetical protein
MWNVFMFQVLILSVLGIGDLPGLIYFIAAYTGGGILISLLVFRKSIMPTQYKYVRLGIFLWYIPLIIYHWQEPFSIKRYDYPYYIAPEIIFLVLSVLIFLKTSKEKDGKQPIVST